MKSPAPGPSHEGRGWSADTIAAQAGRSFLTIILEVIRFVIIKIQMAECIYHPSAFTLIC